MKDTINIEECFAKLSDAEKIMRDYYLATNDPEKMSLFLQRADLLDYGCFIPGICDAGWEIYTENNMFPCGGNIQVFQHLRYTPEFTHIHTMFEIVYVLTGSCKNVVRSTRQTLTAGDFCIVAPNVPHAIGVFDDSLVFNILVKKTTFNDTFFKILTGNHMLSEFFTNILYTKKFTDYLLFHTVNDDRMLHMAKDLIGESMKKDDYTDICMENLLMLIFSRLLRYHQQSAEIPSFTQGAHDKVITSILQYIDRNYKTVTLSGLAQAFNYTSPYMSRIITEATGNSFSEILSGIKMNKALNLLISSDMTVNEISDTLGYESSAYFHRKFKKAMKMTPIEYRMRNTK